MSRPPRNPQIPTRDGVSPSCVALPQPPAGSRPWTTVADFLAWRLPTVTHTQWLARLECGQVLAEDGQPLSTDAPYQGGQRLYYWRDLPDEEVSAVQARVLFRDEHLLVVDKPHFLPVTPTGRYVRQSLLVRLKQTIGPDTLSPIHRIDRETAGLVLFSLRPQDRGTYQALFRERAVEKRYEAIAATGSGLLPAVRRSRIEEDPAAFFRMREVDGEPNSETALQALEQAGDLTRYALEPVTGKRHQLRVHLQALGRPICGDQFYPVVRRGPDEPDDPADPLRLLATAIAFKDPVTGAPRRFDTTLALDWPAPAAAC